MEDAVVVQDASQDSEKTLTQAQANAIVKREKLAVAERIRQEMESKHAQEMEQLRAQNSQSASNEIPAELEERLLARLEEKQRLQSEAEERKREEAAQAEYRQHMEKVAQQYAVKMTAGKDKFSDFDEVMTDFDYDAFHPIAFLANELDNTDEVMYELGKNPTKLAQLDYLAKNSPKTAKREMEKLSRSIMENQKALAENPTTKPPLSRLKSSNVGEDSGAMTLEDYKNAPWLRG